MTLREIATEVGCSYETARCDINQYMAKLDEACLQGAAAIRAEEYLKLDRMSCRLEQAIDAGDLAQVPAAVKVSESLRRLYAIDVQPLNRSELAMRRVVITEIATKLRDNLPPDLFAEVASLLTADEPIELVGNVAIATADEEGAPAPRSWESGPGLAPGLEPEAAAWPDPGDGSDLEPPSLVDTDGRG